jgi:hypothetical protein
VIEVNEEYLIDVLKDYGLNDNQIQGIINRFAGMRIYIRKLYPQKLQIKKDYEKLIKSLPKNEVIKILSSKYEKSVSRIRCIVNNFFQENL